VQEIVRTFFPLLAELCADDGCRLQTLYWGDLSDWDKYKGAIWHET
jgi:hypothetical protein